MINSSVLMRELKLVVATTMVILAVVLAWSWIGTVRVASSALLVNMTVDDLTRGSTLVAVGTITQQATRPAVEGIGVFTDSTVAVSDVLKGAASSTVVVSTRGGRFGNVVAVAKDEPAVEVGQRVLLFLAPRWDGALEIVGGYQGRYIVRGNEAANERHSIPVATLLDQIRASSVGSQR